MLDNYSEESGAHLQQYLDTLSPQSTNDLIDHLFESEVGTTVDINMSTYVNSRYYDEELEQDILQLFQRLH